MIDFAVIGTGVISRQFIDAAVANGQWRLVAAVGSTSEKASAFLASLGDAGVEADPLGSVDELSRHGKACVIYVASPNSMHFAHACTVLRSAKHVLVEKPAFSNLTEWHRANDLADASGVLLLEAARHIYEPNYRVLRDIVKQRDTITGASFVFRQYSSRFPAYRAGTRPRIFTAEYSGGALVDLGVYQLYAALDWFGMPEQANYIARVLADTGADSEGTGLLLYRDFTVQLTVSKAQASHQLNEIYGPDGTVLSFNNVAAVEHAEVWQRGDTTGTPVPLAALPSNPLADEVADFTRRLLAFPHEVEGSRSYSELRELAEQVATVSGWMRADAGVVFPADTR